MSGSPSARLCFTLEGLIGVQTSQSRKRLLNGKARGLVRDAIRLIDTGSLQLILSDPPDMPLPDFVMTPDAIDIVTSFTSISYGAHLIDLGCSAVWDAIEPLDVWPRVFRWFAYLLPLNHGLSFTSVPSLRYHAYWPKAMECMLKTIRRVLEMPPERARPILLSGGHDVISDIMTVWLRWPEVIGEVKDEEAAALRSRCIDSMQALWLALRVGPDDETLTLFCTYMLRAVHGKPRKLFRVIDARLRDITARLADANDVQACDDAASIMVVSCLFLMYPDLQLRKFPRGIIRSATHILRMAVRAHTKLRLITAELIHRLWALRGRALLLSLDTGIFTTIAEMDAVDAGVEDSLRKLRDLISYSLSYPEAVRRFHDGLPEAAWWQGYLPEEQTLLELAANRHPELAPLRPRDAYFMRVIAFDYVRRHWEDISAEIGPEGLTKTPIMTVDHAFETKRLDLQVHDVSRTLFHPALQHGEWDRYGGNAMGASLTLIALSSSSTSSVPSDKPTLSFTLRGMPSWAADIAQLNHALDSIQRSRLPGALKGNKQHHVKTANKLLASRPLHFLLEEPYDIHIFLPASVDSRQGIIDALTALKSLQNVADDGLSSLWTFDDSMWARSLRWFLSLYPIYSLSNALDVFDAMEKSAVETFIGVLDSVTRLSPSEAREALLNDDRHALHLLFALWVRWPIRIQSLGMNVYGSISCQDVMYDAWTCFPMEVTEEIFVRPILHMLGDRPKRLSRLCATHLNIRTSAGSIGRAGLVNQVNLMKSMTLLCDSGAHGLSGSYIAALINSLDDDLSISPDTHELWTCVLQTLTEMCFRSDYAVAFASKYGLFALLVRVRRLCHPLLANPSQSNPEVSITCMVLTLLGDGLFHRRAVKGFREAQSRYATRMPDGPLRVDEQAVVTLGERRSGMARDSYLQ
ncbi:uncharacterized protein SCHCODRAFT_01095313 [Schizophyllum commune H4-8]|uniref:Uncharacterized protein n=1 Tax=Schizophyllum commune (strain H4-8 / FGSC 9210) TaxID=578458 RepID=D8Q646_SCHCM|nr:uncharacterized protein SCHCODRAFT_01095313 [Schizophyllum commune H4-8]KAI5891895.1 hypothetical protein SCHCODRAFT_01095313 [Schizophyllum commune H4-8]